MFFRLCSRAPLTVIVSLVPGASPLGTFDLQGAGEILAGQRVRLLLNLLQEFLTPTSPPPSRPAPGPRSIT